MAEEEEYNNKLKEEKRKEKEKRKIPSFDNNNSDTYSNNSDSNNNSNNINNSNNNNGPSGNNKSTQEEKEKESKEEEKEGKEDKIKEKEKLKRSLENRNKKKYAKTAVYTNDKKEELNLNDKNEEEDKTNKENKNSNITNTNICSSSSSFSFHSFASSDKQNCKNVVCYGGGISPPSSTISPPPPSSTTFPPPPFSTISPPLFPPVYSFSSSSFSSSGCTSSFPSSSYSSENNKQDTLVNLPSFSSSSSSSCFSPSGSLSCSSSSSSLLDKQEIQNYKNEEELKHEENEYIYNNKKEEEEEKTKNTEEKQGKNAYKNTNNRNNYYNKKEKDISEYMEVANIDGSFIVGKKGSTKKKLCRVCCVDIILTQKEKKRINNTQEKEEKKEEGITSIEIRGKKENVEKAKLYINFVMQQRVGDVFLNCTPDTRDDLTVMQVPQECVGYVTGAKGVSLRSIEEEFHTFMFFAELKSENIFNKFGIVKLAIFGNERGRRGAQLKVMSLVEQKIAGYYSAHDPENYKSGHEGFDTETMLINEEDFSYVLGKDASTKKKISRASGAILQYVGKLAYIAGTQPQRQRARQYLHWLCELKKSYVPIDITGRTDVTCLSTPGGGRCSPMWRQKGRELRYVEEETGTFIIINGTLKTGTFPTKILIFGEDEDGRRQAKLMLQEMLPDKHTYDTKHRRGRREGGKTNENEGRRRGGSSEGRYEIPQGDSGGHHYYSYNDHRDNHYYREKTYPPNSSGNLYNSKRQHRSRSRGRYIHSSSSKWYKRHEEKKKGMRERGGRGGEIERKNMIEKRDEKNTHE